MNEEFLKYIYDSRGYKDKNVSYDLFKNDFVNSPEFRKHEYEASFKSKGVSFQQFEKDLGINKASVSDHQKRAEAKKIMDSNHAMLETGRKKALAEAADADFNGVIGRAQKAYDGIVGMAWDAAGGAAKATTRVLNHAGIIADEDLNPDLERLDKGVENLKTLTSHPIDAFNELVDKHNGSYLDAFLDSGDESTGVAYKNTQKKSDENKVITDDLYGLRLADVRDDPVKFAKNLPGFIVEQAGQMAMGSKTGFTSYFFSTLGTSETEWRKMAKDRPDLKLEEKPLLGAAYTTGMATVEALMEKLGMEAIVGKGITKKLSKYVLDKAVKYALASGEKVTTNLIEKFAKEAGKKIATKSGKAAINAAVGFIAEGTEEGLTVVGQDGLKLAVNQMVKDGKSDSADLFDQKEMLDTFGERFAEASILGGIAGGAFGGTHGFLSHTSDYIRESYTGEHGPLRDPGETRDAIEKEIDGNNRYDPTVKKALKGYNELIYDSVGLIPSNAEPETKNKMLSLIGVKRALVNEIQEGDIDKSKLDESFRDEKEVELKRKRAQLDHVNSLLKATSTGEDVSYEEKDGGYVRKIGDQETAIDEETFVVGKNLLNKQKIEDQLSQDPNSPIEEDAVNIGTADDEDLIDTLQAGIETVSGKNVVYTNTFNPQSDDISRGQNIFFDDNGSSVAGKVADVHLTKAGTVHSVEIADDRGNKIGHVTVAGRKLSDVGIKPNNKEGNAKRGSNSEDRESSQESDAQSGVGSEDGAGDVSTEPVQSGQDNSVSDGGPYTGTSTETSNEGSPSSGTENVSQGDNTRDNKTIEQASGVDRKRVPLDIPVTYKGKEYRRTKDGSIVDTKSGKKIDPDLYDGAIANINEVLNKQSDQIRSEGTEVDINGGKFVVHTDDGGNLRVFNSKGKVVQPFSKKRVGKGRKSRMITTRNPMYAKATALAAGELTDNEMAAADKARIDRALSNFIPLDNYTAALYYVAGGGKFSRKSTTSETGEKAHNLNWTSGFQNEKDLLSIERVAENIAADSEKETGGKEFDEQEIRQHLIDISLNYSSQTEVAEVIRDLYEQEYAIHQAMSDDEIDDRYAGLNEQELAWFKDMDAEAAMSDEEKVEFYLNELLKSEEGLTDEQREQYYKDAYSGGEEGSEAEADSVGDDEQNEKGQEEESGGEKVKAPLVITAEQADIERLKANSKLDNNQASLKLAEIAKSENIDLSKLTREEYVDYAIRNGLKISDQQLRNAPELRNPTTFEETMALRKSLRETLSEKTKGLWNKWTNSMELLAHKSQKERYLLNEVRLLSGTANSGSWLFFDVNNSQVDSSQAPYKSYFSVKNFNNLSPERFIEFMKYLQENGYKGGIKTFQDLVNQGVLLNDQFVMHGDTEADARLGEQLAKDFFKDDIKSTGFGKDGYENGKSKSYSQILSDKISDDIDSLIDGKSVESVLKDEVDPAKIEVLPDPKTAEEWEKQNFTEKEIAERREYGITPEMEWEPTFRGVSQAEWNSIQDGGEFQSEGLNGSTFVTPSKELAQQSGKGVSSDLVIEFHPEAKARMREGDTKFDSQEYYAQGLSINDVKSVTDKDGNVVYSDNNDVPLQQNTKKEGDNDSKSKENSRLRSILGATGKEQKILDTIESAYARASESSDGKTESGAWSRDKLISSLEAEAKKNNTWIDDPSSIQGQPVGTGGENTVFLNTENTSTVVKFNRMTYSADSQEGLDSLFDGLASQGELFPELPYEIIGFGKDPEGNVSIIMTQPFVLSSRDATEAEINQWFVDNGFTKDGKGFWSNGNYLIHDYKPANVLVAQNGELAFIDPIIVSQGSSVVLTMDDFDTFKDAVSYNVKRTADIALDESEANYGKPKNINEVKQVLNEAGIEIEKVDQSEMSGGDYASYDGGKIKVTDENIPLQILLHEIGEKVISDLDKSKTKIEHSNNIFEAVTTYGASRGNDAFADNFYLYFLSPNTLSDLSPSVFKELNKLIPNNIKELGKKLMDKYGVTEQILKYNKPKRSIPDPATIEVLPEIISIDTPIFNRPTNSKGQQSDFAPGERMIMSQGADNPQAIIGLDPEVKKQYVKWDDPLSNAIRKIARTAPDDGDSVNQSKKGYIGKVDENSKFIDMRHLSPDQIIDYAKGIDEYDVKNTKYQGARAKGEITKNFGRDKESFDGRVINQNSQGITIVTDDGREVTSKNFVIYQAEVDPETIEEVSEDTAPESIIDGNDNTVRYYQGIPKTTAFMQGLLDANGNDLIQGSLADVEKYKKDNGIKDENVKFVDLDTSNPNSLINKFLNKGKRLVEPKPSSKKVERKIRDEKLKGEIDGLWDDLFKMGPKITTGGIDFERLQVAVKIINKYVEAGRYKLSDIIEDAYARSGDMIRDFFGEIKSAYSAYYDSATDEIAAQMDTNLRSIKYEDIIKPEEIIQDEEQPGTEEETDDSGSEPRDTETIITESELALGQVPIATTPEELRQALNEIEKLIGEVDSKIGKLTEDYDAENIMHESPNIPIGKQLKKDVNKYAKEVANLTGWTLRDLHSNIAPIGGQVTMHFDVPGTTLNVYLAIGYDEKWINGDRGYAFDDFFYRVENTAAKGQDQYVGSNQWEKKNQPAKDLAKILFNEAKGYIVRAGGDVTIPESLKNKSDGKANTGGNRPKLDRVSPNEQQGLLFGTEEVGDIGTGSEPEGTGVSIESRTTGGEREVSTGGSGGSSEGVSLPVEKNSIVPTNFVFPQSADVDVKSFNAPQRFRDNLDALQVLTTLIKSDRNATPAEQEMLSKYVGWGGLKVIGLSENVKWSDGDEKMRPLVQELKSLVTELEKLGLKNVMSTIKASTLSAHFTSIPLIKSVYNIVDRLGFNGGKILEPSAGIGNFFGAMPGSVSTGSQLHGIELEPLTGNILKKLYPKSLSKIGGFENSNFPDNTFDLAISNVPFGDFKVFVDANAHPTLKRAANKIHNYFFVKGLDQLREGGLMAFITTSGTMDSKGNDFVREYLNDNANFLGAIRLPNTAFKGNAGTSVVADIIFLQKNTGAKNNVDFLTLAPIEVKHKSKGNPVTISVNKYFVDNPQNVIGDFAAGGQYREDEMTVMGRDGQNIADDINTIVDTFPKGIYSKNTHAPSSQNESDQQESVDVGDNHYFIKDGVPSIFNKGDLKPVAKTHAPKIVPFIKLRDLLQRQFELELYSDADDVIEENRNDLRSAYQDFVRKFGALNSKNNKPFILLDNYGYNMLSLETYDPKRGVAIPADVLTKRILRRSRPATSADTIEDAISISLNESGKISLPRIADLLGQDPETVLEKNYGMIFKTPAGSIVDRSEYLSGNVKKKLKEAEAAVNADPLFEQNVEALKGALPKNISFMEIDINLGARWVPLDVYKDFVNDLLLGDGRVEMTYSRTLDAYYVDGPSTPLSLTKFGTPRANAYEFIRNAMQGSAPVFKDKISSDPDRYRVNAVATQAGRDKIEDINREFEDWIYKDKTRAKRLEEIYNTQFNTNVKRSFDGSNLTIDGLKGITLRPHQNDAISMIALNNGGIVDHIVGAGKTAIMIGAAMKLKQTGVVNKPSIIALKSTIPHIVADAKKFFPTARILAPTESDFKSQNRRALLSKIRSNDWDIVIMSHEQFKFIPQDPEFEKASIQEEIDSIEREIDMIAEESGKDSKKARNGLEKRKMSLNLRLQKVLEKGVKDMGLPNFSEIGIDHLFVDESQQFKNLPYATKVSNVAGLGNPEGSSRAFNIFVAIRTLQAMHGGDKGTTFLSGTPISNSLVEMYLLMKYLRPEKMRELGYDTFDSWAKNAAKQSTEIEFTVAGTIKTKNRFREFINLPELALLYTEIADVRNESNLTLPRPSIKGGTPQLVMVDQNDDQKAMTARLIEFANQTHGDRDGALIGKPDLTDNQQSAAMLLVTNLSSKLSVDMRLIDPKMPFNPDGKLAAVSNKVFEEWQASTPVKGTQLVFSDIGTPKGSNALENIRDYLQDERGMIDDDLNAIFGEPDKPKRMSLNDLKDDLIETLEINETEANEIINEGRYSDGKFNVYDEIKRLLVSKGIPEEQVAFIHSYKTEIQKHKLFDAVNKGEIRVLLGSTQKLGTGVNVQSKIVAMHHVDASWTPSAMTQRNGRGIRQGNENEEVSIYNYGTSQTLDAYKYQLIASKQVFIDQVKTGATGERTYKEGDGEDMSTQAFVAQLSGNPTLLEKAKVDAQLDRLKRAKKSYDSEQYDIELQQEYYKNAIPRNQAQVESRRKDLIIVKKNITINEEGRWIPNVVIGGKVPADSAERNKWIDVITKRLLNKPVGYQEQIGTVAGLNLVLHVNAVSNTEGLFSGETAIAATIEGGMIYKTSVNTFSQAINRMEQDYETAAAHIPEMEEKLARYEEMLGTPWPKREEYNNAVAEQGRLAQVLRTQMELESKPQGSEDPGDGEMDGDGNPVFSMGESVSDDEVVTDMGLDTYSDVQPDYDNPDRMFMRNPRIGMEYKLLNGNIATVTGLPDVQGDGPYIKVKIGEVETTVHKQELMDAVQGVSNKMYSIDSPYASKVINGVTYDITEGPFKGDARTYLIYEDKRPIAMVRSIQEGKELVKQIADDGLTDFTDLGTDPPALTEARFSLGSAQDNPNAPLVINLINGGATRSDLIRSHANVWLDVISDKYDNFYQKGLELIESTDYFKNNGNDARKALEAAIADNAEKIKSTPKLINWLSQFWKYVGRTLNLNISKAEADKMTIGEYLDLAAGQMMFSNEIIRESIINSAIGSVSDDIDTIGDKSKKVTPEEQAPSDSPVSDEPTVGKTIAEALAALPRRETKANGSPIPQAAPTSRIPDIKGMLFDKRDKSLKGTRINKADGDVIASLSKKYDGDQRKVVEMMALILPTLQAAGIKLEVHEKESSYWNAAIREGATKEESMNSSGFYSGTAIHINLNKPNLQATVALHEAIHPIVRTLMARDREAFNGFVAEILADPEMNKLFKEDFVDKAYTRFPQDTQNEELVVEAAARMAFESILRKLDKASPRLIDRIINYIQNFLGDKFASLTVALNTKDGIKAYANSIADAFSKGFIIPVDPEVLTGFATQENYIPSLSGKVSFSIDPDFDPEVEKLKADIRIGMMSEPEADWKAILEDLRDKDWLKQSEVDELLSAFKVAEDVNATPSDRAKIIMGMIELQNQNTFEDHHNYQIKNASMREIIEMLQGTDAEERLSRYNPTTVRALLEKLVLTGDYHPENLLQRMLENNKKKLISYEDVLAAGVVLAKLDITRKILLKSKLDRNSPEIQAIDETKRMIAEASDYAGSLAGLTLGLRSKVLSLGGLTYEGVLKTIDNLQKEAGTTNDVAEKAHIETLVNEINDLQDALDKIMAGNVTNANTVKEKKADADIKRRSGGSKLDVQPNRTMEENLELLRKNMADRGGLAFSLSPAQQSYYDIINDMVLNLIASGKYKGFKPISNELRRLEPSIKEDDIYEAILSTTPEAKNVILSKFAEDQKLTRKHVRSINKMENLITKQIKNLLEKSKTPTVEERDVIAQLLFDIEQDIFKVAQDEALALEWESRLEAIRANYDLAFFVKGTDTGVLLAKMLTNIKKLKGEKLEALLTKQNADLDAKIAEINGRISAGLLPVIPAYESEEKDVLPTTKTIVTYDAAGNPIGTREIPFDYGALERARNDKMRELKNIQEKYRKKGSPLADWYTTIRSTIGSSIAMVDLSAVFVQGYKIASSSWRNPKLFFEAFTKSVKAAANEFSKNPGLSNSYHKEITKNPYYDIAINMGLNIPSPDSHVYINEQMGEQDLLDKAYDHLAKKRNGAALVGRKVLGVRRRLKLASNASFATHLNIMSMGTFSNYVDRTLKNTGHMPTPNEMQIIAREINNSTGRPTINQNAAQVLPYVFWAPRLYWSQILNVSNIVLDPVRFGIAIAKGKEDEIRAYGYRAKNAISLAMMIAGLQGVKAMVSAWKGCPDALEWDWQKSDHLKVICEGVKNDMSGNMRQWISMGNVFRHVLMGDFPKNFFGQEVSPKEMMLKWLGNHLNPANSFILSMFTGRNFINKQFIAGDGGPQNQLDNRVEILKQSLLPLWPKSMYQFWMAEHLGLASKVEYSLESLLGFNINTDFKVFKSDQDKENEVVEKEQKAEKRIENKKAKSEEHQKEVEDSYEIKRKEWGSIPIEFQGEFDSSTGKMDLNKVKRTKLRHSNKNGVYNVYERTEDTDDNPNTKDYFVVKTYKKGKKKGKKHAERVHASDVY